jgi:hypothetical protein
VTGDQLIEHLRALPADVRALHVVYMDHDQCGDPFIFPAGMPQVEPVRDAVDRTEYGDRVIVV